MTRVSAIVVLVAFAARALAQTEAPAPDRWLHSYAEALKAATDQKKPLLVDFRADWCGWCDVMDRDSFAAPEVDTLLGDFVCVKVDIEADARTAFAFGVSSIPRIIVANVHGEIIGDRLGYMDAAALAAFLQEMKTAAPEKTSGQALPAVDAEGPAPAPPTLESHYGDDLTAALADPDPRLRQAATEALVAKGEAAVPGLVAALASDILAVRIGAWEALQAIAKPEEAFDPWAPKTERLPVAEAWRKRIEDGLTPPVAEPAAP